MITPDTNDENKKNDNNASKNIINNNERWDRKRHLQSTRVKYNNVSHFKVQRDPFTVEL